MYEMACCTAAATDCPLTAIGVASGHEHHAVVHQLGDCSQQSGLLAATLQWSPGRHPAVVSWPPPCRSKPLSVHAHHQQPFPRRRIRRRISSQVHGSATQHGIDSSFRSQASSAANLCGCGGEQSCWLARQRALGPQLASGVKEGLELTERPYLQARTGLCLAARYMDDAKRCTQSQLTQHIRVGFGSYGVSAGSSSRCRWRMRHNTRTSSKQEPANSRTCLVGKLKLKPSASGSSAAVMTGKSGFCEACILGPPQAGSLAPTCHGHDHINCIYCTYIAQLHICCVAKRSPPPSNTHRR